MNITKYKIYFFTSKTKETKHKIRITFKKIKTTEEAQYTEGKSDLSHAMHLPIRLSFNTVQAD